MQHSIARVAVFICLVSSVLSQETTIHDDIRNGIQQLGAGLNQTAREVMDSANRFGSQVQSELEPCTEEDCNGRGTCMGTKKSHVCVCQIGYSGANCDEGPCDSARDCNGKGLCMGTSTSYSCVCQIGYSGQRCELVMG